MQADSLARCDRHILYSWVGKTHKSRRPIRVLAGLYLAGLLTRRKLAQMPRFTDSNRIPVDHRYFVFHFLGPQTSNIAGRDESFIGFASSGTHRSDCAAEQSIGLRLELYQSSCPFQTFSNPVFYDARQNEDLKTRPPLHLDV